MMPSPNGENLSISLNSSRFSSKGFVPSNSSTLVGRHSSRLTGHCLLPEFSLESGSDSKDLYEFLREAQLEHYFSIFSQQLRVGITLS
ncbi:unnamed protein product [Protopolystoma xenopodis]|uniref:Uncharacterized protein n=1 Tax=Protopolystoma xenopodis TaxID=117903 RepID=A0A448WV72_9PLAT|nr:unnamed protein product [Protopolystoma xenopodis]